MVEVMKIIVTFFKRFHGTATFGATTGDSQTLTGKSGSVSCGVTAPFPGAHKVLFVPAKSLLPSPV